ncbi:hypothetical protein ACR71G_09090 [Xenorhabdus bovienii]|uniref:hypothetical protein n=1 Tax=Xenorhabdus bovienii TaxID=40576 RepID=UPI003DA335B5
MQNRSKSKATVHQSVAGRRWQALCRPHPQNGRPPPGKPGSVRPLPEVKNFTKSGCSVNNKEKEALYCTTAYSGSRAKAPRSKVSKQAKNAHRRFKLAVMSRTGKNGSLIS